MKEPTTMLIIRSTGAQASQELPPMHPECKVVFKFQILARAKALRKEGEFLQAEKLVDAVLCVCREGPHHRS
jgi:hypothetical protein